MGAVLPTRTVDRAVLLFAVLHLSRQDELAVVVALVDAACHARAVPELVPGHRIAAHRAPAPAIGQVLEGMALCFIAPADAALAPMLFSAEVRYGLLPVVPFVTHLAAAGALAAVPVVALVTRQAAEPAPAAVPVVCAVLLPDSLRLPVTAD